MQSSENDIRKIEDLEDGSSVYEIGADLSERQNVEAAFHDNLADTIFMDAELKKLSTYLLDAIQQDIDSSDSWFKAIRKVKEYLSFDIEDTDNIPFRESTRTFDTTLANALIRGFATTRAEMLPMAGPVDYRIIGPSSDELEDKGQRVKTYMNYYLTVIDKAFYSDYERFLLHLWFNGTAFRKVYYDTIKQRPLSRFVMPEDFIFDTDCTSIMESNRQTHVLHLSKREILLKQQHGIYRDVELSYLKSMETTDSIPTSDVSAGKDEVDLKVYEKRSLFPIYECHVYLNLDDFSDDERVASEDNIPLPYIVILDPNSKEILSIRRNWEEDDPDREKINFFIHYICLPGFGIRGLGYAHLLGSNAISLTTILRELIDAGKYKNLPGGLRQKGIKQQDNDIIVGPGEWIPVDTGGVLLDQAFMPLPYSEPSQTLRELRLEVMDQTKELASTAQIGMLESKEDIPVGTMMANLEDRNRIQSGILRSIHYSFSQEIQLIDHIFRKTLDANFYTTVNGQMITAQDFVDEIEVIPVSDPSSNSTTQKMFRANSVMSTAINNPEEHDMREVMKMYYKSMGIGDEEIRKILKADPREEEQEVLPLDPVSENLNILKGIPVKAAMWQNHPAHIYDHGVFAEYLKSIGREDLVPVVMSHITDHHGYDYLIKMQQLLGYELPPLEEIQDPEVQNRIAMELAGALEESGAGQPADANQPMPLDINAIEMAKIQQKEEEMKSKERIENLRAEVDVFKAQLDFEKSKAEIESSEDIAQLKSETELQKQENSYAE